MARFFKKRIEIKGADTGSLIFVGKKKIEKPRIRVISYNENEIHEIELFENSEILNSIKDKNFVHWLNIDGLDNVELMAFLKEKLNLHPLLLEDVMNTGQRPKFEEFDSEIIQIYKMLSFNKEKKLIESEQLSLIIKDNLIISFQERVGDVFEPVRNRLRNSIGRIRSMNSEYLAYSLSDTVIDNYIFILENIGEDIENLEEYIIKSPSKKNLLQINQFKIEINFMSKVIRPVKDLCQKWLRSEHQNIHQENEQFIKDIIDLITHTTETLDTYRTLLNDYMELYNSAVNNKLNEIMKVLTIFSAVFIPLTFIAGIYGTNFDYLPELHYKYSYLIFWIVLIFVGSLMLLIFKKKKWF